MPPSSAPSPSRGPAPGGARRRVVEFLLDGRSPALPATLAVLGLIAVAGPLAPWFPVGAAVVVGLTFPVGSGFGLDGPNGAQLFALLLSTGWAGSQASVRRSWRAPAADQVLATPASCCGPRRRRPGRTSSSACCCGARGRSAC